jgi:hypothetical protein
MSPQVLAALSGVRNKTNGQYDASCLPQETFDILISLAQRYGYQETENFSQYICGRELSFLEDQNLLQDE